MPQQPPIKDTFPQVSLSDAEAQSRAILSPTRGGMISRWSIANQELLYLDSATFLDLSKNVRGGNPVLFPSPGKLQDDTWEHNGMRGHLKQHGFARNLPWYIVDSQSTDSASAIITLSSNEQTRLEYPFDFEARYRYALRKNELRIEMSFTNTGNQPMPFGAGFHPYFAIPQEQKNLVSIDTKATRAFDNTTKKQIDYSLDLTVGEVDLHLLDHGSNQSALRWPGGVISLEGSAEFSHWVIWTLPQKDFVCLEPWTCPGNALNTGERLIELTPGQTHDLWLCLRFEPAS